MVSDHADGMKKQVRVYMLVFVALLVLTFVTVTAGGLTTGVLISIAVALVIATVKGFLVAGYFMHLTDEKPAIYGVLIITVAFFAAMMILFLWGLNSPLSGTVQRSVTAGGHASASTRRTLIMSLKAFHIVFITASTLLAVGLGLLCLQSFIAQQSFTQLGFGIMAFGAAIGLIIYGLYFLKKLKDVRFL